MKLVNRLTFFIFNSAHVLLENSAGSQFLLALVFPHGVGREKLVKLPSYWLIVLLCVQSGVDSGRSAGGS